MTLYSKSLPSSYSYIYPVRVTIIQQQRLGFHNFPHGIRAVSLTTPILGSKPLPQRAAPGEINLLSSGARHPVSIKDRIGS